MSGIRYITRTEFCEATHVSKEDPVISVYIDGQYLMPAFGIIYLERKEDKFTRYYVKKMHNETLWRLTPIKTDTISGTVVHRFKPITSDRFKRGYWDSVKTFFW